MKYHWVVFFMVCTLLATTGIALVQDEPMLNSTAAEALLQVAANTEYIPAQAYFPCRVLLPADYDPARAYPLVIGLHGFGSDLDQFATLWYVLEDPQFILAVPQAPYSIPLVEGGGASWLPKEDLNPARWNEASVWTQEYILAVARSLQADYRTNGTYLAGFSQGGMLAYTVALQHPNQFLGVAGIGSVLPPQWITDEQLAAASAMRVFIAHSPDDEAIPLALAQETRDRLSGAGLPVEYMEYTSGHSFTFEVVERLAAWVRAGQEG